MGVGHPGDLTQLGVVPPGGLTPQGVESHVPSSVSTWGPHAPGGQASRPGDQSSRPGRSSGGGGSWRRLAASGGWRLVMRASGSGGRRWAVSSRVADSRQHFGSLGSERPCHLTESRDRCGTPNTLRSCPTDKLLSWSALNSQLANVNVGGPRVHKIFDAGRGGHVWRAHSIWD